MPELGRFPRRGSGVSRAEAGDNEGLESSRDPTPIVNREEVPGDKAWQPDRVAPKFLPRKQETVAKTLTEFQRSRLTVWRRPES